MGSYLGTLMLPNGAVKRFNIMDAMEIQTVLRHNATAKITAGRQVIFVNSCFNYLDQFSLSRRRSSAQRSDGQNYYLHGQPRVVSSNSRMHRVGMMRFLAGNLEDDLKRTFHHRLFRRLPLAIAAYQGYRFVSRRSNKDPTAVTTFSDTPLVKKQKLANRFAFSAAAVTKITLARRRPA